MFNIYHQVAPSYFCNDFNVISHRYSTRFAQHNFNVPQPVGIDKYNFSYQGVMAWNDLPVSIKSVNSKQLFKHKVRNYLKAQAHYNENRDVISF